MTGAWSWPGLRSRLLRLRQARAVQRRAIPEILWHSTLAHYPFLAALPQADRAELRRLSSLFLDSKEFTGAGGLQVTDDMAVAVAAQACLPVLRLGLTPYDRFVGIVLHPAEVSAPRMQTDEDGVVHAWDEPLVGEAMDGGPLMLAWSEVRAGAEAARWGSNVVIHEFAHVLDLNAQTLDRTHPACSPAIRRGWHATMEIAYAAFCRRVDAGEYTVLDPYGAEAPQEFFAVAAEAFFVTPVALRTEHPDVFAVLKAFFQQDLSRN